MLVLGIETSCDETAVSVVENGRRVRSNIISSSLNFHKRYKGVVPEIASRLQLETISLVLSEALEKAGLKLKDIKLIAVTSLPGLPGSLVVGNCFARSLSFVKKIPIIYINHLHAHLYAAFLNRPRPVFPFVGLVVSGGHTSLFYVKRFSKIQLLGQSQDDACGEAYDKVAGILGLGYPGGPIIERLAKKGDSHRLRFNCSNTQNPLNFSFSGIKTAVLYLRQSLDLARDRETRGARRKVRRADIAAAFQETVIDTLVKKSILACRLKNTNQLVVGGGVAANNRLREKFAEQERMHGLNILFSPKEFCTDNAAMVAGLGYWLHKEAPR